LKDVKDDYNLVINSTGVLLEVNERGKLFYKTFRDIVERTYRHTFHSHYKNQSNKFKNQVIHKLQEEFLEQWLMRPLRLAIEKNCNNKN
jgi:hypothetical protein